MVERGRQSRILRGILDLTRAFSATEPGAGAGVTTDEHDPVAEAYERGRREGLQQGQEQAREEYESKVETLERRVAETLGRLGNLEEELNHKHEHLLVELALEAAAKIARRHIAEGDPVASRALEEAIEALPTTEPVRARLHPDDADLVRRDLEVELSQNKIELIHDEGVERGGCIVESRAGTIDATLETAIETVLAEAHG